MPNVTMPDIAGAFTLSVTARFDDVQFRSNQKIFDFGDGTRQDAIVLGQVADSTDLRFTIYVAGQAYGVTASNALIGGETATWTVAVSAAGVMTIAKNGTTVAQGEGQPPAAALRSSTLVGESNQPGDAPLAGEVSSLIYDGLERLERFDLTGDDSDETFVGGPAADTISALGGNDSIDGNGGDDSLIGGSGNDTLRGGHGDDTIEGGPGNDEIEGFYGDDVIDAGAGDDHVFGRDENDIIYGRGGADTLIGGIGDDTLFGGDDDDLLAGSQGNDVIHAGGGNDLVFVGPGEDSDTINLNDGNDYLDGGTANARFVADGGGGDDRMVAGSGNDQLAGGAGQDQINGGSGDDDIEGGTGNDTLDGDGGTDTAHYSGAQSSYTLTLSPDAVQLADRRSAGNGTDSLVEIELLDFETNLRGEPFDLRIFAGMSSLGGEALESFIELYIAYFNRAPDAVGLFFWGTAFAEGTSLEQMATYFIDQDETRATYPEGTSNKDFASAVYTNVLGRTPDPEGFNFWVAQLNSGAVGRDQFILEVLRGAKADLKPELGQDFVDQQIADRAYLETKTDIGAYFAVHKGLSDTDEASAAMALFDGTPDGLARAVSAIDFYHQEALDPVSGDFLMPLIGVLDDPFTGS